MSKEKILVIGACGQIGVELTLALRAAYGRNQVIASDLKTEHPLLEDSGPYISLDVLNKEMLRAQVIKHNITQIYLLAALLSATGEKNPLQAWRLNIGSLLNVLEVAREEKIKKLFWPSSIAVFGPGSPKIDCPQQTIIDPATVYGISKHAGEEWCQYYFNKYGVDVRSLRYPGLISYKSAPGGGTTDYAIEIFYKALKEKTYTSFLDKHTVLPMMYMPDAIRGTIEIMEAPMEKISLHTSYNISAMSFSPEEIAGEIRKHIPEFQVDYAPDYRQAIGESWPQSIDDKEAKVDWGWNPEYDLSKMTKDMLQQIARIEQGTKKEESGQLVN